MSMKSVLNAQRLIQLSQFHPKLQNIWYLVAAVTFSVCNHPQELPKLYHYALALSNENADIHRITLAGKCNDMVDNCMRRPDLRESIINEGFQQPSILHSTITRKFRESILKSGPLAGLPKAINGLHSLKEYTPLSLLPSVSREIDPWHASVNNCRPYMSNEESKTGTGRVEEDFEDREVAMQRGLKHWNSIYNKVSQRIINNMNSSYPDLWYYTLVHVYGPLLSNDEVLSAQETSFIVIAALVPQDVNPQLKGHLRGALNIGCHREAIEAARSLAILVAKWCGVTWHADIVKL